jgi:hypothetical protein
MVTWFNNTKTDINYGNQLVNKEQGTQKEGKRIKTEEILKKHHSNKKISL